VRTRIERRGLDGIVAVAGLAVLVVCGVIAHSGTVSGPERAAFRAINELPDALSPPMRAAQFLGVLAVGPIVAVVAFLLRRWRLGLAALLVTGAKLVAERTVWHFVSRSRPGTTIPHAIVRGSTPTAGAAFVSGHVVLVTGLAWVIAPYLRGRWRILPWMVVALVAFTRVYLGAHAPLDILGGAALGLMIGGLTNLAVGVPADRVALGTLDAHAA
jgi:membrane-associated phospholipid phosphatase